MNTVFLEFKNWLEHSFYDRRKHGNEAGNSTTTEETEMEEETEGNEDTCQEVIKAEDDYYDGRTNSSSVNL